jgi:protein-S-isoprenylcysteine O-methyltransferase Ste14
MNRLNTKAFGGLLFLLLVMGALLFLPAWTLDYWQAWAFLAVFGASALAITLYLMKKDPMLLERRMQGGPTAEKEWSQKIIQTMTAIMFIAMLVVPALDHRLHWSTVSLSLTIAGNVLVGLGFLIIFFVYKENTFASATIELAPEQKVVTTGLYALVRHPMYMGALFLLVGMPLALGSWWGLFVYILSCPRFSGEFSTRRSSSRRTCEAIQSTSTRCRIACCHTSGKSLLPCKSSPTFQEL